MGDTCDAARTHYRKHVRSYQEDENSQEALDEWHRREVRDLAKILLPIRKRIMGAILGNHFWEYLDGTNSEQYLCQLLGIPYLGPVGVIRLEFMSRTRKQVDHSLTVVAHHNGGSNGGRTPGADVNALKRAEDAFDADIHLLSHTHRRHGYKEPILVLSSKGTPRLLERTKVFVRTGAFLKGFKEDRPTTTQKHLPSYAEQKLYRPTDLGWVEIHIKLTGINKRGVGNYIHQDIKLEY